MSYCYHWASVVHPSLALYILIFSSETTGLIWTKLGRDGPWMVPFQNWIQRPHSPTNMAAIAKNRNLAQKIIKNLLLWNYLAKWDQPLVEWSLGGWSPFRIVSDDPTHQPRWPTSTDIVLQKTLREKCFKDLLWNRLAYWYQTLIKWSLGGPVPELCPMPNPPTKAADISRHSFNIEPYGKNVLKIFSSITAWPIGTRLWCNGP